MTRLYERDQFLARLSNTLSKAAVLFGFLCCAPLLIFVLTALVAAYYFVLIMIMLMTIFLILLDESFRNLFGSVSSESLAPIVNALTDGYYAAEISFAVIGVLCAIGAILIGVLQRHQRYALTKSFTRSGFALALIIIGVVLYFTLVLNFSLG